MLQVGRFTLNHIVIFTGLWHTVPKNKTRNFHHEKNVSIFRARFYRFRSCGLPKYSPTVLGTNKTFKLQILSVNEVANPAAMASDRYGRQIGNSRTSIGLSNTPDLHNSEDYATRQALEARPSTLRIVRYSCS